jgi:Domain of unknown function (DUF1905)
VIVKFEAELWLWDARQDSSWTFVSLPEPESADIRETFADAAPRAGFGSIRVRASIGGSTWDTSIFPDAARGGYVLPVKKAVRKAERIEAGDLAKVTVEVLT